MQSGTFLTILDIIDTVNSENNVEQTGLVITDSVSHPIKFKRFHMKLTKSLVKKALIIVQLF